MLKINQINSEKGVFYDTLSNAGIMNFDDTKK